MDDFEFKNFHSALITMRIKEKKMATTDDGHFL